MNDIPYGKQEITAADIEAVVEALKAPFITQGPRIRVFEENFAGYIGAQYAVAVANGTAALHLCAIAMNVSAGQKVITTPITFSASANCVRYCGGEVCFADVDPETALLDVGKVRAMLGSAPSGTYQGLIPVDFAGFPVDMEAFRELADEFGLWIIEDACHAPGAYFFDSSGRQQYCGNGAYADLSIFSFHPVKHIACGEGGMITTNRKDYYERLCALRSHGIIRDPGKLPGDQGAWFYDMVELGYNYRLTDIQSALGLSQLQQAAPRLERRREIARIYDAAFRGTAVRPLAPGRAPGHAYHLYVVRVGNRKALYEGLRKEKIFAQVHYIPVHYLEYYRRLGWRKGDFPGAEAYYGECLSLPMYPSLSPGEQDFVIEKVLEYAT